MIDQQQRLRYIAKRLLQLSLVALVFLVLVSSVAWYILRSDDAYIIRKLQETAYERYNADVQLSGYRLRWVKPYPLIQFELEDLRISVADQDTRPVFRISRAVSQFNPWNVLTGNFRAHPFQLDSVWVHLYKDANQRTNFTFRESQPDAPPSTTIDLDISSLPSTTVQYLDFQRRDDYQGKWQGVQMQDLTAQPKQSATGNWVVHVQSDAHFDGLVFKESSGGYLLDTDGMIDLQVGLINGNKALELTNSTLSVGSTVFQLSGQFHRAVTNRIKLQIGVEQVVFPEVMPLLSQKINTSLGALHIDRPLDARFSLDQLLNTGEKSVLKVDFSTTDACIQYKSVVMNDASLSGYYSNDCDEDGIGGSERSCVLVEDLTGNFFDVLPTQLEGVINNLLDPHVEATGEMNLTLPQLNTLLASKKKMTFSEGRARVSFAYAGQLNNILDAPFDDQNVRMEGHTVFDSLTLETSNPYAPSPSLSGKIVFDKYQTSLEEMSLDWLGAKIQLGGQVTNLPEFLFYEDQTLISDLRLHFDRLDLNEFRGTTTKPKAKKKRTQTRDEEFLEVLAKRIARNVNGSVQLQIDSLFYDTIFLTDLRTQFKAFSPLQEAYADSAMIRMDQLTANFMGTIPMYIDLQLSRTPITELLLDLHLPATVELANFFAAPAFKVTKGAASMQVSAQVPLRAVLESNKWLAAAKYQGRVVLEEVAATSRASTLPFQRVSGAINFSNDRLQFDDLRFHYDGSPFSATGNIVEHGALWGNGGKKAVVDLQLKGTALDLRQKNTTATNESAQSQSTPAEFFRSLDTLFQISTGKVVLRLDSLLLNQQTFSPVQLTAQLQPDGSDYQLKIDDLWLGLGPKNSIKGKVLVHNPAQPAIDANLQAVLQLKKLGQLLPSQYVEMQAGHLKLDLQYQSPLHDTLNAKNYLLHAQIKGDAEMVNGKLFYNYRDFSFDHIYTHLSFDERALYIRDLDMTVNGNRFIASGESTDFFPFFILPDRRAHIDLTVTSPRFDFGGFTSPHGLGKDSVAAAVETVVNSTLQTTVLAEADTTKSLATTVGYIDQLLDRGSVEMRTQIDSLVYDEFLAQNIAGKISLQPDTVQLDHLRMDVANGTFTVDGLISDIIFHQPKVKVNVALTQNNVREVFRQFDNFGQSNLRYENLEGLASAEIRYEAAINSDYVIQPETMYGDMSIKLTGGQLIDLDAMKKLTGFFFKNRQLDHILIDTLEVFTHIRGNDLYLDYFNLHSSSFDFGAEGVYSFSDTDKTRVLFSIPIRNLFRRHVTAEEMSKGNSERKGLRILIEARQKQERMRFRWKLFNFGKKKYRLPEE